MNRRERLRRCYYNEELDRPAAFCRMNDCPKDDRTYDKLREYIKANSEVKERWNSVVLDSPYPTEKIVEPYSEDFERHIIILHTPKGDLRCSNFVGLKMQPGLEETHLLKNREDAEKYLSLPLPEVKGDVSGFFAVDASVGDAGIPEIRLGFNPAGFVSSLFGSEMFAMMSVMERDIIHALCERQMKLLISRIKFLIANKVGPYFSLAGEEQIVPPLHGPEDFYDFNVKYDTPIIDLVHDSGGRMHVHSHGSIKKVMKMFVDMGTDVLHPFEPPPMGDITAKEAKDFARGKMCLEGNIQIHRLYEVSPEEIREEVTQLMADAFDDHKGLIVCPSASPYLVGQGEICFPQYKAMVDTVLNWKE